MTYMNPLKQNTSTDPIDKIRNLRRFEKIDQQDPTAVLRLALGHFESNIALASSFSLEDVSLIDMMMKIEPEARIFALDTGRLNEETYECAEKIRHKYACTIEWFFPHSDEVEKLIDAKGLFSFKESIENRHECCQIRKVDPLERALGTLQAWITGQRRQQSTTRVNVQVVETDQAHGSILKLNPLAFWSAEQVRHYVEVNRIPYNRLYDQGYQSIGCAPCTRPCAIGDDERSGRWWWESAEHKECGIHLVNPKSALKDNPPQ